MYGQDDEGKDFNVIIFYVIMFVGYIFKWNLSCSEVIVY